VRLKNDDFDSIIQRAIRSVLRERLEEGEEEFQDQTASKIKARGLKAPPEKKNSDDDDDDEEEGETDEADDEEGGDEEAKDDKSDKSDKKDAKPASSTPKPKSEPGKPQIKIDLVLPDSIKSDDIEKKLNLLRAGKSLKDEDTKKRFDTYFSSLSAPQKVALKGFLDGLSQVILGEIPGNDAKNPSDSPYNVKMDADPDQESEMKKTKTEPKKVVSRPSPSKPSGSNTPIVVGESANKSELLRLIKSNV